jgi:dienelactone hydrolase
MDSIHHFSLAYETDSDSHGSIVDPAAVGITSAGQRPCVRSAGITARRGAPRDGSYDLAPAFANADHSRMKFFALTASALASVFCALPESAQTSAPVSTFAYDRSAPLQYVETRSPSPDSAIALFQIRFASPSGGTATGELAVPAGGGRHPAVLLMHGLPGNANGAMRGMGMALARRGAVVLALDAPFARRTTNDWLAFTERDSVEQVQLFRDLQRAVDVLLARPDVDAQRIAYLGVSYGGAMGSGFVGIESRLAAAVLVVADGGLVAHFTSDDGSAIGPLAGVARTQRERWLAAMRPIEPMRFLAGAKATLLLQNGRQDQLVTNEDAEALHRLAPAGATIRWYDGGHGLTAEAATDRFRWLADKIGTRP